jgi:hypothetical protein
MFRELLESNNKDEWIHISYTCLLDDSQSERIYLEEECLDDLRNDGEELTLRCNFMLRDNPMCYGYGVTSKIALEQACMQYCIENGVRLEWLKSKKEDINVSKHIEYHLMDCLLVTSPHSKLIAAIYAHDIKIIAT